jgi:hypothetical protein
MKFPDALRALWQQRHAEVPSYSMAVEYNAAVERMQDYRKDRDPYVANSTETADVILGRKDGRAFVQDEIGSRCEDPDEIRRSAYEMLVLADLLELAQKGEL